jgi:hypothetical protein
MTTSYDTDPHAPTIAAAWASSSLGQPDTEVRHGFDATDIDAAVTDFGEPPTAKRVMVAAGIACAVAAGALTGVMLFYAGDSARPAVTVPAPDPRSAVLVDPSTVAPAPEQKTATTAVRPAPRVTQLPVSPSTSDIATPPPAVPQPHTTVVVDIPPLPDNPAQQDPEPPKPADPEPEPPVSSFPDFKLPTPPKPKPPVSMPDLTLAPNPPAPKPPVVIDPVFSP